jgi:hypothetical protein
LNSSYPERYKFAPGYKKKPAKVNSSLIYGSKRKVKELAENKMRALL